MEKRAAVPLSRDEVATYVAFAGRLADASGAVIRPYFRAALSVGNKAGGADAIGTGYDPVTAADHGAETAIRERIKQTYPSHGIFGEEHGYEPGSSGLTWVIDPIDGTRAFITGVPLRGTLIALHDGERPILGVMDQPYTRERFTGSVLGAELQTPQGCTQLRTRACAELAQAILSTTHPAVFQTAAERAAFKAVAARVRMTRFGGDCYSYCMLAHGLIDLIIESSLLPYDVQALIPIIAAAGGVMTSWSGAPADEGGQVVAAGDPRVHAQALELLAGAAVDR
jgi:myo-inositol-1(or 4)-monophosphatase